MLKWPGFIICFFLLFLFCCVLFCFVLFFWMPRFGCWQVLSKYASRAGEMAQPLKARLTTKNVRICSLLNCEDLFLCAFFSLSLHCIYSCVCSHIWVCVCPCAFTENWGQKKTFRGLLCHSLPYSLERGSPSESGVRLASSELSLPLPPASLGLQA